MQIPETNQIFYKHIARTEAGYTEKLKSEYQTIRNHLPDFCSRCVTVDSGLSGINLLLNFHYFAQPEFYILNYPDSHYDPEKKRIYDITIETTKLMLQNGINNFRLIDLRNGIPLSLTDIDIMISHKAWGYLYPVDMFIDQAIPVMKESGILILDIFRESKGLKTLAEYFKSVNIIKKGKTADKVVASEIKY